MREDWELKKWDDVLEIRSGRNQKEVENPKGAYPIYGSGGTIMGYADDYICEEGTTIIGRKGTIDNPLFIETKFWNVDTAFGLIAGDELDKRYLYYFCLSFDFTSRDKGTTLPSLVKKDLVNINIPIPPLPEQKRIVAILDEAFEAIDQAKANIERNIQNAEELFQSKLNEIFSQSGEGWEEKSIEEITKVINGYAFKSNDFSPENTVKAIKITNVGVQEFVEDTENNLPSDFVNTYDKVKVERGAIVIALTRTIISNGLKVARVPDSYDGALVNQRVAALSSNNNVINPTYLYYFLSTDIVSNYVLSNVNTLMQPNLSIKDLKRLKVPVCSISKQKEITFIIESLWDNVGGLINSYKEEIKNLNELKKSILQKAFSGELTANEHVVA
ncbi:MAG: restriction endonuclease subunit S [Balneolaceae bacterium]|nr:restriction endonuclease subunit S [Balneolaceae bacterium]MCH8550250.1 restriction endonuclease subunit S [Balneolaceae bacterium]